MYLIAFISFCLLLLTFLSICAKTLPELRASVLAYGKLNVQNVEKPTTSWATLLATLTVPKHYFSHFYVVGLAFALLCTLELTASDLLNTPLLLVRFLSNFDTVNGTRHLNKPSCVIGLTLLTLHLTRRCYESFWVEHPSKTATMHISHYIVGIAFYGAMVFGTWLEGLSHFTGDYVEPQPFSLFTTLLAIALFFYASLHQYRCHVILASLRKEGQGGYKIPRGDWFEWIVTPHYFADILIYLSLCILYRFQNIILVCGFIWTVVNLSVVASETQSWYLSHFKEKYHAAFPQGRWKIIPFLY